MRLRIFAFLFCIGGLVRITHAANDIDLASSSADFTVWGAAKADETGNGSTVGDFNGDGAPDIAIGATGWSEGVARRRGKVSIFFGPLPLPGQVDLLSDAAPAEIVGEVAGDHTGLLTSADLDGDGIDDLLVGSDLEFSRSGTGSVSIFRGRELWPALLTLSDADWTFYGAEAGDGVFFSSVADLNGDGDLDMVLFGLGADGPGNSRSDAGEAFVYFGPARAWAKKVYDLSTDPPGVHIYGASASDYFGRRFAVGQVVSDGISDLAVAAVNGDGPMNARTNAGNIYVFRGRPSWPAVIDLAAGGWDLVVYGPAAGSGLQSCVIGDWDGDAVNDLVVGAEGYEPGGRIDVGGIFVLRGGGLSGTIDLAVAGSAAETIVGPRAQGLLGYHLGLADVNGDGYADIVTTTIGDDTKWGRTNAGAAYVISGCSGFESFRDLAAKPAEIAVYGANAADNLGTSIGLADLDGDGRVDLLLGAFAGDSTGNSRLDAGEAYVILGRATGSVCSVAADADLDRSVCGIQTIALDGSASVVTGCAGSPQFRWLADNKVVRDWSANATATVAPTATTTFRLEVRCGDCGGPCLGAATVSITVDPGTAPPDLGNSLRAVHTAAEVVLTWRDEPLARSYGLYRGTLKGTWPMPPYRSGLAGPTVTLPDLVPPPALLFYRAAGASCSGSEGP